MSVANNYDIDPTECVEIMRSVYLSCTEGRSNKDYQAVFGVEPKSGKVVSWVEWGRIAKLSDANYKKQFKVHYAGNDLSAAIAPVEEMLIKKALGKGTSRYTLTNGEYATWQDYAISEYDLQMALNNWNKENVSSSYIERPRKRIRAGNVLIPFARRSSIAQLSC